MTTIERIKKLAKKYNMNLQETAEKAGRTGLWKSSGMYGKNTVFSFR